LLKLNNQTLKNVKSLQKAQLFTRIKRLYISPSTPHSSPPNMTDRRKWSHSAIASAAVLSGRVHSMTLAWCSPLRHATKLTRNNTTERVRIARRLAGSKWDADDWGSPWEAWGSQSLADALSLITKSS